MKPKLHAMMNVYEESAHIEDALNSIAPFVDKIWIIDGTVKQFPAVPDWNSYAEAASSRDGTIELIKAWTKKTGKAVSLYESGSIWEDESLKKNYLLGKIPYGDYVIQLDGDETLFAEKTALSMISTLGESDYQVPILFTRHSTLKNAMNVAWTQPRVWRNDPSRLFKLPSKSQLVQFGQFTSQPVVKKLEDPQGFSGNNELLKQGRGITASGMRILPLYVLNNPAVRPIDRQKRREIYYTRLFGVRFL